MTGSILELKLDNSKITPETNTTTDNLAAGISIPASNVTTAPVSHRRRFALLLLVLVLGLSVVGYKRYADRSLVADLINAGLISKDTFTANAVRVTFMLNKQLSDDDIHTSCSDGI